MGKGKEDVAGKEKQLRRLWLAQLLAEYRTICRMHRVALTPPVFEIIDGQSRAGTWSPGFSTLGIASWLIIDHSWDVVLEVLRHEICHQYVQQTMGQRAEPPHGPAFQEACHRFAVHPAFRTAQGGIPRFLPGGAGGKESGMLARVEKLFALAQSANEHEAALAMQKANGLLRRHNLERLEHKGVTAYDYLILSGTGQRLTAHQRSIAALLRDFFHVQVVISRQFDARSGQSPRVMELMGVRDNLLVAEYVYHFLMNQLSLLWQEQRRRTRATGREKNSYWLGVLNGFRQKLADQEKADSARDRGGEERNLICTADPGLVRYCRSRHPWLRTERRAGPRLRADSYQAGQREGRQLVLHRGVAAEDGNRGGLLPCP